MMRILFSFRLPALLALAVLAWTGNAPALAAYTDNGDGTVTDTTTGLMWDKCSWGQSGSTDCTAIGNAGNNYGAGAYTWQEALMQAVTANASNYKGHNDWRPPNVKELESIVKIDAFNPAIDTAAFPNAIADRYWSSTPYPPYPAYAWAWYVDFQGGNPLAYAQTGDFAGLFVRLVRSGQASATFDAITEKLVQFPNASVKVSEAANNVVLKVNRSGVSGGAVSVAYATADGTATAGTDYVATAGTLNWADGDTAAKTISVPIVHDNVSEAAKTFSVALSSPTGIALGVPSSVSVTMYENVPAVPFVDISGNWAASYINAIYGAGITTGCGGGNYCPAQSVTRGQMAAFIIRAKEGEPASSCATSPFSDVPISDGFCKYVKRMMDLTITTGCGGGNYCPNQNVTRDQIAAFIIRAVEGNPVAGYCGSTAPYSDVPASNGFCGHIKRMAELGITTGCGGGNYCPSQTVTRDQMAVFLARAFLGM